MGVNLSLAFPASGIGADPGEPLAPPSVKLIDGAVVPPVGRDSGREAAAVNGFDFLRRMMVYLRIVGIADLLPATRSAKSAPKVVHPTLSFVPISLLS